MRISATVFLKFLGKELISPVTYLVAFLIGASINVFQGNSIFFSAVPYVVPLFVQGFAKASLKFKTRIGADNQILVSLDEISAHKARDLSLSSIRRFSREVINAINELAVNNDIYDRLALLILREGYQGVFITREDPEGNLSGYAFKGKPNGLIKSKLIQVPENSSAPIWASRKAECDINGCVATATKPESMPQAEFENKHSFNESVKAFLGFAITNYINYAEGDVSIIAFNKHGGIKKIDSDVINTVVNTARTVTHLIDLAIGNNRMLSALEVAEEVQQNLLPKKIPTINGLDIAAKSIYCNKTGGDFYDFLNVAPPSEGKLHVLVGDVSGHGIAAGLLMTTARALLRSRSAQPGTLAQIVTDVNRDLTLDIYDTGRFATLIYLMVDLQNHRLKWVRAGHDAALLYDPIGDSFEDLYGSGLALGWDENYRYEENVRIDLTAGQIIFLGTDGIWETFDKNGNPFGKEPIKDIIRQNTAASADEIMNEILAALRRFRQGKEPEDDVTLVVIKIVED